MEHELIIKVMSVITCGKCNHVMMIPNVKYKNKAVVQCGKCDTKAPLNLK